MNRMPNNQSMSEWLDRAWLQRYLERKLSEQETEWFEMYVLDKPHLIAEIEADNDLRDGLVLADAGPVGHAACPPSIPGRSNGGLAKFRLRSMAWAASVVVAMGMGWMLAGPLSVGAGGPSLPIIASPSRVVFDTLRGVESPPLVYPGASDSGYVLVEVGLPPDATNVVLHLAGHDPMPLVVSPDGFASFLMPRDSLGVGAAMQIEYASAGAVTSRVLEPLPEF